MEWHVLDGREKLGDRVELALVELPVVFMLPVGDQCSEIREISA
jgi:hypothetical protein